MRRDRHDCVEEAKTMNIEVKTTVDRVSEKTGYMTWMREDING